MKTIAPKYYDNFKCIAGKCRHSCCVGWEIDIDDTSLERYQNDESFFGKKILENIEIGEDGAKFRLDKDERCPFLNSEGLCDIIIQKGEDALCSICSDHPRFRNFFSSFTETGLGMCCEEAVRVILKTSQPFTEMFSPECFEDALTDEERSFLSKRRDAFNIICDRANHLELRISKLLKHFGIQNNIFDFDEVTQELLQCEILDNQWRGCIDMLTEKDVIEDAFFDTPFWENVFEQLISYFIFRHLADSLDDGRFNERLIFAILGYRIIKKLCRVHKSRYGKLEFEDVCTYCRMFSSEIEYSDENTDALLDYIMFS